jgi:hypothetical protein
MLGTLDLRFGMQFSFVSSRKRVEIETLARRDLADPHDSLRRVGQRAL